MSVVPFCNKYSIIGLVIYEILQQMFVKLIIGTILNGNLKILQNC